MTVLVTSIICAISIISMGMFIWWLATQLFITINKIEDAEEEMNNIYGEKI